MTITAIKRPASLQTFSQHHTSNESSTVTFESYLQQEQYVMDQLLSQSNLFAALQMVNQINRLNNSKVISVYQVAKIKSHYSQRTKCKNQNGSNPKKESTNQKGEKSNMESFKLEYQKCYYKMLSQ